MKPSSGLPLLLLLVACLPDGGSVITVPGDADGDGYYGPRADCDDTNADVHPGASDQTGDAIDSDCGGHDYQDPRIGVGDSSLWCTSLQACLEDADEGATIWVGSGGTYVESNLSFGAKRVTLAVVDPSRATTIVGEGNTPVFCFLHDDGAKLDGFVITNGTGEMFPRKPCGSSSTSREASRWILESAARLGVLDRTGPSQDATEASPTPEPEVPSPTPSEGPIGGGIYMAFSNVTISNCIIKDNGGETTQYGGGVAMFASAPTLTNCRIEANTAKSGAQVFIYNSQPSLTNCIISGGQSLTPTAGGGILSKGSSPLLNNCIISRNVANIGAGIYIEGATDADDVPTYSTLTLLHGLVYGNAASTAGGGIYLKVDSLGQAALRLQESILTGNSTGASNGDPTGNSTSGTNLYVSDTSTDLFSLIVHIQATNLYDADTQTSGYLDSFTQLDACDPTTGNTVPNNCNFVIDPVFVAPSYGDFHLAPDSPLIDLGSENDAVDHDGSRPDLGCYGGAFGNGWDLDFDEYQDYFWPGDHADAPDGFLAKNYDCNDSTPSPENMCE